MRIHVTGTRSFATPSHRPTGEVRKRELFISIGEPCERQPKVFYDVRNGARAPWRLLFRYFRQAFDAARTAEGRHRVVHAITAFLLEGIAQVRLWIVEAPSCRREIFLEAQSTDADEDLAETAYLTEPTPANAARLIEAGRRERITSEARERHLMLVVAGQGSDDRRPAA